MKVLSYEYDSIMRQYQSQSAQIKKVVNEKETDENNIDQCEYCKKTDSLTDEEKQRHQDYHIQLELLRLNQENSEEQIIKQIEQEFGDKKNKTSLQNVTKEVTNRMRNSLQRQKRRVHDMFSSIMSVVETVNLDVNNIDINMSDWERNRLTSNPQYHDMLSSILISVQVGDDPRCKTCDMDLQIGLDVFQDWSYNKDARRVNNIMYCSSRCVVDNLNFIDEQSLIQQPEDSSNCHKCHVMLPIMGNKIIQYCNDILYDSGCSQNCGKCCAIRVSNMLYCNHKCAGFICEREDCRICNNKSSS